MPRPRSYRCDAVVLKRHDFGEADRLLVLFTRQRGKLRAVAKGVRRTTSRMSGHVELFCHAELQLARGRDLDLVTQAETRRAFRRVREDLTLTSYAYLIAELADSLTAEHAEQAEIFDLIVQTLGALEECRYPRLVVNHYQVLLLGAAGYRPSLSECLLCREELRPGANAFSTFLGGTLCPRCGPMEVSASPISSDCLKALRYLQRVPLPGQANVILPDDVGREVDLILRELCERHSERRLRSSELIARIDTSTPV